MHASCASRNGRRGPIPEVRRAPSTSFRLRASLCAHGISVDELQRALYWEIPASSSIPELESFKSAYTLNSLLC